MRKTIFLVIVVFGAMLSASAQIERSNFVIGNGLYHNAADYEGTFRYLYLDVLPITLSESAVLGFFGLGSENSGIYENYKESSYQYGGGLVLGIEPKYLLYNSDIYIDFHLGYMFKHKSGEDNKGWSNTQDDHLAYLSTYAHIDNSLSNWFYRHKLFMSFQYSLYAQEESFWEHQVIDGQIWDMSTFQAKFEESIVRATAGSWTFTPKLLMGYSYQIGDHSSYIEPGIGLDIFIKYYQNLFDVYYQKKMPIEDGRSYHMIGASLNLVPLIKVMVKK